MGSAFLFPGQGAQYVGMGKDFFDQFEEARRTFEEADDVLKCSLSKTVFEGPSDLLLQTRYSQLGIFVASVAMLRTFKTFMPEFSPDVCAGLSLGEYTALCASEKLKFQDALLLIRLRADLMNAACEETKGAMAAVLGLSQEEVDAVVLPMGLSDQVWVANYNCPGQVVISGSKTGVAGAAERLKTAGAKRVIPLDVHGAFHSPFMQKAQDFLLPDIRNAKLLDSPVGLVMNAAGAYANGIEDIRSRLSCQITSSVRWEQGIRAMMEKNISFYLEIGCGKTLTGMNRKIGVQGVCLNLEKVSELDETVRKLQMFSEGISCNC